MITVDYVVYLKAAKRVELNCSHHKNKKHGNYVR